VANRNQPVEQNKAKTQKAKPKTKKVVNTGRVYEMKNEDLLGQDE
jgi:hypothetical protein